MNSYSELLQPNCCLPAILFCWNHSQLHNEDLPVISAPLQLRFSMLCVTVTHSLLLFLVSQMVPLPAPHELVGHRPGCSSHHSHWLPDDSSDALEPLSRAIFSYAESTFFSFIGDNPYKSPVHCNLQKAKTASIFLQTQALCPLPYWSNGTTTHPTQNLGVILYSGS